jgi:drug/metabolite transporter (DMT)-like permease
MPRDHRIAAVVATSVAMLAFAGNSILSRMALMDGSIDPASFTTIRLLAGALTLAMVILATRRGRNAKARGSWAAAAMLFLYAVGFSYAYVSLGAATGALILFGFVQATMISVALYRGERPAGIEVLGWLLARGGLTALLLPGASSPGWLAAGLMASAGIAWGIYSILGKNQPDPLLATGANFLRSTAFVLVLFALTVSRSELSSEGVLLAVVSGALTSGMGYVVWYAALNYLSSLQAALVLLSVPALAAAGGALLLTEELTLQIVLSGLAILGGLCIALLGKGYRR